MKKTLKVAALVAAGLCSGVVTVPTPNGTSVRFPGALTEAVAQQRGQGTVKWFNAAKGYGFIARQGEKDILVSVYTILGEDKTLEEGQRVEFTIERTIKGMRAIDVKKL